MGELPVKETLFENTPLFAGLSDAQRAMIADRMVEVNYRPGDLICQHCQPSTALYVIKSGWVRLMTEQFAVLANVGPGSLLGEADVILGRDYTITAEASGAVTLLALRSAELADIVAQDPQIGRQLRVLVGASEDQERVRHLRKLGLFAGLNSEQLREVAGHLRPERFAAGQTIHRRGTPGTALYLIDSGQVSVQALGQPVAALGPGEFFGEIAMLTAEPHTADIVALTDVIAWSLTRNDFEALVLRFPSLALNLSRALGQRLRQSIERSVTAAAAAPVPAGRVAPTRQPRQGPAPAQISGAVTGLNQAANAVTTWFGAASTGAKLRLVALILLLIWFLGVVAPSVIISLLSSSSVRNNAMNSVVGGGFR